MNEEGLVAGGHHVTGFLVGAITDLVIYHASLAALHTIPTQTAFAYGNAKASKDSVVSLYNCNDVPMA